MGRRPESSAASRRCRDDRIQRACESFWGLVRQAVDEIDIDGSKAPGAARIDDTQRLLHTLDAVYGLLDPRVKVLHAEARAPLNLNLIGARRD